MTAEEMLHDLFELKIFIEDECINEFDIDSLDAIESLSIIRDKINELYGNWCKKIL